MLKRVLAMALSATLVLGSMVFVTPVSAEVAGDGSNLLKNSGFETGDYTNWSRSSGSPEVVKAEDEAVNADLSGFTAYEGEYVLKCISGSVISQQVEEVYGQAYKVTVYAYGRPLTDFKTATPDVTFAEGDWNPGPFNREARAYYPEWIHTTDEGGGWTKYELGFAALPLYDNGGTAPMRLYIRNWDSGTFYLDDISIEKIPAVYMRTFADETLDSTVDGFGTYTVSNTTGATAVKALKLDTSSDNIIIPLDKSKLSAGNNYHLMMGIANRTDFAAADAENVVDSEVKLTLMNKVSGSNDYVATDKAVTVKASDLYAYAKDVTTARINLQGKYGFVLPASEGGEYALKLSYVSGTVGLDLTYINLSTIYEPDKAANLILYEGFDYDVTGGDLNDSNKNNRLTELGAGGNFWQDHWRQNEDKFVVADGTLSYTDGSFNILKTEGNRLVHGYKYECNISRRFKLATDYNNLDVANANGHIGVPGTTVYASYLVKNTASTPRITFMYPEVDWNGYSRLSGINYPAFQIFVRNDNDNNAVFTLEDTSGKIDDGAEEKAWRVVNSNAKYVVGETYFIVVKMEFTDNGNKFSLYVNPKLGEEPATANAVLENTYNYTFGRVAVDGKEMNAQSFDEFRLGKTYNAVTPISGVDEVAKGKYEAVKAINEYLNPANYRDAEKETITSTIATWSETINACATVDAINQVKEEAFAALDTIKTDTELTAEELAAAKKTAKDELDVYKNADDYRDAQKTELANAISSGKDAIDACTVIDDVAEALKDAKEAIDTIKTDADLIAEELLAAKNTAKAELDSYKNADDYRDAQKTELADAIAAGKAAIDACEVIGDVPNALADAKVAMDAIKTDVQLTAEELAKAKEDAIAELDGYKSADEYRDAEKVVFEQAVTDGKNAINACTVIGDVAGALKDAKDAIDVIKTDADLTAEELLAAKNTAKAELDSYKNTDDYRDAQKTELADAIDAGKAAIDACEVIGDVSAALANAKSAMDEIKTANQLILEETKVYKMQDLRDSYPQTDYRADGWTMIEHLLSLAQEAVDAATSIEEINDIIESSRYFMDEVSTDAQLTEFELISAKDNATTELDNYKNPADYREEQKTELANAIADAKLAINAATDIAGVDAALSAAKDTIDAIKTNEQLISDELAKAKADAKASLETLVNMDDYRETEKQFLVAFIDNYKASIDLCNSIAEVKARVVIAKAYIHNVKTLAELLAEENKVVNKVKFVKKNIKIKKGKKAILTLKVKLTPAKGLSKKAKKVKWSINKKGKKIVKFVGNAKTYNGKLKARVVPRLKKGTAKITCKAPSGKKAVCKITVK